MPDIARIARDLLADVDRQESEMSIGESWEDKILDWGLGDPERKTRILRFVDVFPALKNHRDVVDHLKHYFPDDTHRLPMALRMGLRLSGGLLTSRAVASSAGFLMEKMARRFIGGETVQELVETVEKLRSQNLAVSIDFLGEATLSEAEADRNLETLTATLAGLGENGAHGAQINFSVKCSSLTSWIDPIDPDETGRRLLPRLRTLLRVASKRGAFIHIDTENYDVCDLTLDLILSLFSEKEFSSSPDVGLVLQAYLRDAQPRAARVLDWCRRHRPAAAPITIRLVKGAYWDSEIIRARRQGWEAPVWLNKPESDACFERILHTLLESHKHIRTAVASHNLRAIAAAVAISEKLNVPKDRIEFQFLYGMARATRAVLARRGFSVRVYTPYGPLIPGMAYLVRRLLENSSNDSFLRIRRLGRQPAEILLQNPNKVATPISTAIPTPASAFVNSPAAEFHKKSTRNAMWTAVRRRMEAPAERIGPVLNGRRVATQKQMTSVNPSHPSRIVADVDMAGRGETEEAVRIARQGWAKWKNTTARDRGKILRRAAGLMEARQFEMAALEVFEAGKPWAEAIADVAEAVDYLRYYPTQAERLEEGTRFQPEISGETNIGLYRPRGVAAVISPWNFPLAICAGQTAAALAAGNTVVFKPAEQTPLTGYRLYEILREAGLSADALQFLPGVGEVAGAALVDHPGVDVVAFTGSRAVGEEILRRAAAISSPSGPKRIIAEMGGKNAVIVDSDADLDMAVAECLQAAFDYAGQKCSALSRLILLDDIYESFLDRFAQAARNYPMGFAEIAATRISPLIDAGAKKRVTACMEIAEREGRWVLPPDENRKPAEGFFVPPAVVAVTSPQSKTAQDEIFGPLVAAIPAKTLDEAIAIANGTDYALTGGFFSRHPEHIERVKREFNVGNLYINRSITGAIVGRQPFGGHRASGVGSKAGGPDYLAQFCIPVTVSENLARHGFSPDVSR